MAKMDFGGVEENVVTRNEFPLRMPYDNVFFNVVLTTSL